MTGKVERTLAYDAPQHGQQFVGQHKIEAFRCPVVILGDPGLGKTVLTEWLGDRPGAKYVVAGTLTRHPKPQTLISEGQRIVVDGLDQIASAAPGSAVEAVLKQLAAMGYPPFILSCREADWLGAADRIRIKDDYGEEPALLRLQPFTRDDACTFLSRKFPEVDPHGLLDHIAERGIDALYGNPLTLRMLGEVALVSGSLPETRADLFDRACRVMLREKNPHHHGASHTQTSEEELLLAAGAVCATQLLCDRVGVYTGPNGETPEGFLHVADVNGLPRCATANEALSTRIFQAEGENLFTHIHRVIAEYLGARWLACCFEDGISEKRIFGLFRHGEGMPTSLRGLHAWMAHFSEALARRCIRADPYGVLRYGNAETLDLEQAKTLLSALEQLSERDPYFRSEDWGRHPASGLMRSEFRDYIRALIESRDRRTQFTDLLLEAMAGTDLARDLAPALDATMCDPDRFYHVRACAWEALRTADDREDWEPTILRLVDLGDPDSATLAFNILTDMGPSAVSSNTVIDTVLCHIGFGDGADTAWLSRGVRYIPDRFFEGLATAEIGALIDGIVERAKPFFDGVDHSSRFDFADIVRRLAVQVLEADSVVEPERIWSWVGWFHGSEGYKNETKKKLASIFRENLALRAALVEYVLLSPCGDNAWVAGHSLGSTDLGLYPNAEDVTGSLRVLRLRAGDGPMDAGMWRDLLLLGRTADGIPSALHDAATEAANGDAELLSTLAELSDTSEPEWKIEQRERRTKLEAERQRFIQAQRAAFATRATAIAAGDTHVLATLAYVYMGYPFLHDGHYVFDSDQSPIDRMRDFLGEEFSEHVMAGFVAVLERDDLPGPREIAEIHCENKQWPAEQPMICGVTELLRRGRPLDPIHRRTLAAAYMACQRHPDANGVGGIDVGAALEKTLFRNESEWEDHFRDSIEPQMDRGHEHVSELYRLTRDPDLAGLAGRLSVDWLRRYPAMPLSDQTELLDCALRNAPQDTMRALVVASRATVHPSYGSMLQWLSADFAIDFDNRRARLQEATVDDPALLWIIRDRVASRESSRFGKFTVDQLAFIVEGFGTSWKWTDRPTGVATWGNTNPWDATEFIRNTISAIAGRPSPEATEALQRLVGGYAPSYIDTLKHALAQQLRARRDAEYQPPTISQFQAVMANRLPESVDDMRAYLADRIEDLQEMMRGSNTDMWEAYWKDKEKPRGENFCRNRMIEHISGRLPESIRFEPEFHMPGQKRADIAAIRNAVGLPVEIKGQWHRHVWNAASDQLDANYARDWRADGRGAYIVLWFGDVPGKRLQRHPDGLDRPESPEALRQMLIDRLPEGRRSRIDVFVIDVSYPADGAGAHGYS